MQVFLSWSGGDSQRVAEALKPWLQRLFAGIEVWMSAHDIQAGTPWATVLHQQLKQTDFGLLCLTPENLTAPWILYEAGALALSSKVGCVVPLLLDVAPEKLPAPLAQFQSVRADREGAWKIVRSLGAAQAESVTEERLQQRFDTEWPGLARRLGLDISALIRGDVVVITPKWVNLSEDDAVRVLRDKVGAFIRDGHHKVVLDLGEVKHLPSAGLAFLIATPKLAVRRGAEVVLVNLQPAILEVFAMTHLLPLFRHFPTLDEALAYFERGTAASGAAETPPTPPR